MRTEKSVEYDIRVKVVSPEDRKAWEECQYFEYTIFVDSKYIDENPEKRLVE